MHAAAHINHGICSLNPIFNALARLQQPVREKASKYHSWVAYLPQPTAGGLLKTLYATIAAAVCELKGTRRGLIVFAKSWPVANQVKINS